MVINFSILNSMIKYLSLLLFGLVSAQAAIGVRTSEYTKTNALPPGGLINIAMPGNTNVAIYGSNLVTYLQGINTNGISYVTYTTNSTSLTNIIDVTSGGSYYYLSNMVTNVVFNITNTMQLGNSTNKTLNFFFTGATNGGPNYTVTFACPSPSGFVFRWGINSATNGSSSTFTVTNNYAVGASLTFWASNFAECYYQTVR